MDPHPVGPTLTLPRKGGGEDGGGNKRAQTNQKEGAMTLRERARQLRKEMTDAERRLWSCLRMKQVGARFRRQVPMGGYVVDFVCFEKRLIVEVDGGQHL
jgi:very-short-patch-repair endonuclease